MGAGAGHTLAITYSGSTVAKRYGILADKSDALTITSSCSVRLWLDYIYVPTELSGLSDEPVIPVIYHMALFYYTMKELLLMSVGKDEDPAMSVWYDNKYMREVMKARSTAMGGYVRSNYHSMRKQRFL